MGNTPLLSFIFVIITCRGRIGIIRGWNVAMGCFGRPPPPNRHPLHHLPADVRTSAELKVFWPLQHVCPLGNQHETLKTDLEDLVHLGNKNIVHLGNNME